MSTETAFNLSVALSSLVLLLASLVIREERPGPGAITAYRLAMGANTLSWLLFIAPLGSAAAYLAYPLSALYQWCFVVFAGRRAGDGPVLPALALFALQIASYGWLLAHGNPGAAMHATALFFPIVTLLVCRSLLWRKQPCTLSDIGLAVSFVVLLAFVLGRSLLILTRPGFLAQSQYLPYVLLPAFYAASGVFALAGYLEEAQQRRREQALRDPLTGLLNRRGLDEHMPPVLAYAARQSLPVTLIALDIDRFKSINDRHGHEFGDRLLQSAAEVIRRESREVDLTVRFGGEEFLVLLAYGDLDTGLACAERMRRSMRECELGGADAPVHFSASFGVASANGNCTIDDIYRRADAALYRAKNAGRDRVEADVAPAAPVPGHAPPVTLPTA